MPNKIEIAVEILRASCGFTNSVSGTEAFLDVLSEAVKRTKKERTQSHRDGLGLDCQAALGGNLAEILGYTPSGSGDKVICQTIESAK